MITGTTKVTDVRINGAAVYAALSGRDAQERIDDVAEAVLTMQKALCPVDTGKLVNSLEIRRKGNGRQIGTFTVKYGKYVELGHETRGGTWVPAQPFIRPSLDAARKTFMRGK